MAEDLDIEIKLLFEDLSQLNTKDYKQVKKEVMALRLQKASMNKRDYLTKLIALRDSLN